MQFNSHVALMGGANIDDKNRHQSPNIHVPGVFDSYRDLIQAAIAQALAGMRVHIARVETKINQLETKLDVAEERLKKAQQKTQDYVEKCTVSLERLTRALNDTVVMVHNAHAYSRAVQSTGPQKDSAPLQTLGRMEPDTQTSNNMRYWH